MWDAGEWVCGWEVSGSLDSRSQSFQLELGIGSNVRELVEIASAGNGLVSDLN